MWKDCTGESGRAASAPDVTKTRETLGVLSRVACQPPNINPRNLNSDPKQEVLVFLTCSQTSIKEFYFSFVKRSPSLTLGDRGRAHFPS